MEYARSWGEEVDIGRDTRLRADYGPWGSSPQGDSGHQHLGAGRILGSKCSGRCKGRLRREAGLGQRYFSEHVAQGFDLSIAQPRQGLSPRFLRRRGRPLKQATSLVCGNNDV